MELKMLIDKVSEIQTSYHKNLTKFSDENSKLNQFLSKYSEKYSLIDKKLKKLDHLLMREKIKNSIINSDKLKKLIFTETSKTNKAEFELMNSIFSAGKSNANETQQQLHKSLKVKDTLFQVIKSILNNPKNKNKINENVFAAYNHIEENFRNHCNKSSNNFNNSLKETSSNANANDNNQKDNNYYSPHFSKQDKFENSDYSSFNNYNNNNNNI